MCPVGPIGPILNFCFLGFYCVSLVSNRVLILCPLGFVTDLVLQVCQLLRRDLQELIDGMEGVKPWDEG